MGIFPNVVYFNKKGCFHGVASNDIEVICSYIRRGYLTHTNKQEIIELK